MTENVQRTPAHHGANTWTKNEQNMGPSFWIWFVALTLLRLLLQASVDDVVDDVSDRGVVAGDAAPKRPKRITAMEERPTVVQEEHSKKRKQSGVLGSSGCTNNGQHSWLAFGHQNEQYSETLTSGVQQV